MLASSVDSKRELWGDDTISEVIFQTSPSTFILLFYLYARMRLALERPRHCFLCSSLELTLVASKAQ